MSGAQYDLKEKLAEERAANSKYIIQVAKTEYPVFRFQSGTGGLCTISCYPLPRKTER